MPESIYKLRKGSIPNSTLRGPGSDSLSGYEDYPGSPAPVISINYGAHTGEPEAVAVAKVRATWRKHQDRGRIVGRVAHSMDHNQEGLDRDSWNDIHSGRVTRLAARTGAAAIARPRSAQIVVDHDAGTENIFMGTTPATRHSNITSTARPQGYAGLYGDPSRELHSGHIADVTLNGATATVFTDDRIPSGPHTPRERAMARRMARNGIILVDSDGKIVDPQ